MRQLWRGSQGTLPSPRTSGARCFGPCRPQASAAARSTRTAVVAVKVAEPGCLEVQFAPPVLEEDPTSSFQQGLVLEATAPVVPAFLQSQELDVFDERAVSASLDDQPLQQQLTPSTTVPAATLEVRFAAAHSASLSALLVVSDDPEGES